MKGSDPHKVKKRRLNSKNGAAKDKMKDDDNDSNDDDNDNNDGNNHDSDDDDRSGDAGKMEYDKKKDDLRKIDKDDDKKDYLKRRVTHGYHLVQGKMNHGMEDYIVAQTKKLHGIRLGLYAIFDGHSGSNVAEFLQKNMFHYILSEDNFWENPQLAIKRAYRVINNDILEDVCGSRGGSTAVTAILIDRRSLVVGNVGDSRAVLCKNGKANQITVDHEPKKEKHLVESRGGFVSHIPGNVPRVDGQLAMTRAFGDRKLKDHITVEPDVMVETLSRDVEFIILASDGLWKVLSNQEACDCIGGCRNAQEASEALIKEALRRKSLDDISCVVIMFH